MRMIIFSLVGLAFLFAENFAAAGIDHGNGGGVVVCRDADQGIISIELLDFYEQRKILQLPRDMGPDHLTYLEKVHYVLNRRSEFAPYHARIWGERADHFEENAMFLSGVVFDQLHDTGNTVLQSGCHFEQLVIQQQPAFPRDRLYRVSKDLWDRLDDDNKAGMVLHEIIYNEAIGYGHEDSFRTRYLNGIWTSAGVPAEFSSLEQVNMLFSQAHFVVGEAYGCTPPLFSYQKTADGQIIADWQLPRQLTYYPSGFMQHIENSVFPGFAILQTAFGPLRTDCAGSPNPRVPPFAFRLYEDGLVKEIAGRVVGDLHGRNFAFHMDFEYGYWLSGNGQKIGLWGIAGTCEIQGQQLVLSGTTNVWINVSDQSIASIYSDIGTRFRLKGVDGRWYSNVAGETAILKLAADQLVESCDGCDVADE